MDSNIPAEVQRFVATHITSLDQLEVLLLVSSLPDREWSADAVYRVVLSNPVIVAERLTGFVRAGLLVCAGDPPLFRYGPSTDEKAKQIAALGALYKTARHKIIELIYKPADPLKHFSDAFKFKHNK